ncbi:MAG: DinB family protein [Chitinophagaceae bacterium]
MKKFKSEDLINELQIDVGKIIAVAEFFKGVEKGKLVYQDHKDKWSVVQILEHLNSYGRYYLPAIDKAIAQKTNENSAWFNPGRLGSYFTNSMKPTNVFEVKNKMKAMKNYCFPNNLNVDTVLNEFLEQKNLLLRLLEVAKDRDLNTIRISIAISKLIRLKLGDVFRFLVAHEQRHMIQARNTLKVVGVATDKFPVILQATPQ